MNRIVATLIPLALCLIVGCSKSPNNPVTGGPVRSALQTEPDGPPLETAATVNAEIALATALTSASAQNKRVLVHLGAPW